MSEKFKGMPREALTQASEKEKPEVNVELFDPSVNNWEEVSNDILEIEHLGFGDHSFDDSKLAEDFSNPNNIIVIMRSLEGKIIGFSYAVPDLDEPEGQAAYIEDTVIQPDYQHKKLIGDIMNMMESEIKKRNFKFITRDAATPNGYADKIQKHYGDQVTESFDHDSDFGPQRHFKIKIEEE